MVTGGFSLFDREIPTPFLLKTANMRNLPEKIVRRSGEETAAHYSILDRLVHNAHRIEMRGDSMREEARRGRNPGIMGPLRSE
jgi:hypothetical protein